MEADEVADLLNEIFLLDVEWDFHEEGRPISTNTLVAFQELCRELAKRLLIKEFHAAIWFLSQARYFLRGELPINELFAPLDLSVDQRERIAAFTEYIADVKTGRFPERGHLVEMDDAVLQRMIGSVGKA